MKELPIINFIRCVLLAVFIWVNVAQEPLHAYISIKYSDNSFIKSEETGLPFNLPSNLASISAKELNKGESLFVLINDLHNNGKIQERIYEIIEQIEKSGKLTHIYSEGAPQGKVNLKLLTSLPDLFLRNKVLREMLCEGKISASEAYCVINNKNILFGIENKAVYEKNLQLANKLLKEKKYLKKIKTISEEIKTFAMENCSNKWFRVKRSLETQRSLFHYRNIRKWSRLYCSPLSHRA